jgi:hypothetical protein
MSEGISLSGLWSAFSKFLFTGGVTGGLTGCSSKSEEATKPTPTVEEILAARQAARQKGAGTQKDAPPVTCEPNRMVILQETVVFGPATAGEAISLAPFDFIYADESGEKAFPQECKLTVADQSITAKVSETVVYQSTQMEPVVDGGMSIAPIAIKITPEGTLTIATAGDYDVGISCIAPNAFSMEKIGTISISAGARSPIAATSTPKKGKGKVAKKPVEKKKSSVRSCTFTEKIDAKASALGSGKDLSGKSCTVVSGVVAFR